MKHSNLQDEYNEFRRNHYSIPSKNAVYIALMVYYAVLVCYALFVLLVAQPILSPAPESNEERNEAIFKRQKQEGMIPSITDPEVGPLRADPVYPESTSR